MVLKIWPKAYGMQMHLEILQKVSSSKILKFLPLTFIQCNLSIFDVFSFAELYNHVQSEV